MGKSTNNGKVGDKAVKTSNSGKAQAAVKEYAKASQKDPTGSYTGTAKGNQRPVQDADDL